MKRRTRVLAWVVVLMAAIGCGATVAQQSPQPQTQQATPMATGLQADPLLGLTIVQVALIAAAIGVGGTLLGIWLGGRITFRVQSRLDKERRGEVEQRLAYAQLVQVTAFAAGTRTALDRITPYGATAFPKPNAALQAAVDKGEIPKPVAWCALIASTLDDRKFRTLLRPLIGLFVDSTASFNEALSAMQIRGKDFADMAPKAIATHSAALKEITTCATAFKSLAAGFADYDVPSDVLGRMALTTWQAMERVASSLEALRQSLIAPAKVTTDEAASMYAELEAFATAGSDTGIASNRAYDRAVQLLRPEPSA